MSSISMAEFIALMLMVLILTPIFGGVWDQYNNRRREE